MIGAVEAKDSQACQTMCHKQGLQGSCHEMLVNHVSSARGACSPKPTFTHFLCEGLCVLEVCNGGGPPKEPPPSVARTNGGDTTWCEKDGAGRCRCRVSRHRMAREHVPRTVQIMHKHFCEVVLCVLQGHSLFRYQEHQHIS